MAEAVAVTNTSPVIALASIGQLRLFDVLFDRIVVPLAVWGELTDKPGAPEPGQLLGLRNIAFFPPQPIPPEAQDLDLGERHPIAVVLSIPGARVLLDERDARRVAAGLQLSVRGTLGILAEAKRRGLVSSLRDMIARLSADRFRLSPELIATVLASVGE